jgi:hypothetical protein
VVVGVVVVEDLRLSPAFEESPNDRGADRARRAVRPRAPFSSTTTTTTTTTTIRAPRG